MSLLSSLGLEADHNWDALMIVYLQSVNGWGLRGKNITDILLNPLSMTIKLRNK